MLFPRRRLTEHHARSAAGVFGKNKSLLIINWDNNWFLFIIYVMDNRVFKQVLYGGLLIAIIGVALLIIYRGSLFTPATCSDEIQNQREDGIDCGAVCGISCERKYLKPLSYSGENILQLGDLVTVYFDLVNPNPNFGLKSFKYQIDIYGFADKFLKSVSGEGFVYPNETKKLVEAGEKILGEAEKVKITFLDANWQPASDFRSIKMENIGMRTAREGDFYAVSGRIKNLYSFAIPTTVVNAFLMDKSGNVLSASKTVVDSLDPFGEKAYKVYMRISPSLEDNIDFAGSRAHIYPIY